jgi:hypothetical protein
MAIYDRPDLQPVDRGACPLARDFDGGWVAMRSGWRPGATLLLFDVGQPIWRSRQHFDAGQFQVFRQGRLAIDSGDDVTYQAVPRLRGDQYLGDKSGDWEQYFQSTIAHNCVTVVNVRKPPRRYGRAWLALGTQRLVQGDYRGFDQPIEQTPRATGHLLAFETNADYSYAAADLAPAFDVESVLAYTREMLMFHDGPIFVIDRVTTSRVGPRVTWHCHFAAEPLIDAEPPAENWRIAGERSAGMWQTPARRRWLTVDQGKGRLYLQTLVPQDARWTLIGGPGTERRIPEGPYAGLRYVGGEASGFEHWLVPAGVAQGCNAWYRLGRPANLGPQFGLGGSWGRLDVQPVQPVQDVLFLHLLWAQDRISARRPRVSLTTDENSAEVRAALGEREVTVRLALREPCGGRVTIGDRTRLLTKQVMPQTRLPSD